MTGLKSRVGKKVSREVKFMGDPITIYKLSAGQIIDIQHLAKDTVAEAEEEDTGLGILLMILKGSTEGGEDLTEEDLMELPMEELSTLSNEIMKFSGVDTGKGK